MSYPTLSLHVKNNSSRQELSEILDVIFEIIKLPIEMVLWSLANYVVITVLRVVNDLKIRTSYFEEQSKLKEFFKPES